MTSLMLQSEILKNILNGRALIATAVALVLSLGSAMVLQHSYRQKVENYASISSAQETFIDTYAHTNRLGWMSWPTREPSRFEAVILGIDAETQEENFLSNPVPALLPRFDLVTIVTIIMSLMAIIFSFGSLCGERETGLLRLLISTGGSRASILAGKYAGSLISLLVPATIGMLAGFSYLAVTAPIQIGWSDLAVFGALLAISWLFLSGFVALGFFVSGWARTSGQSILVSLILWALLVLVIPNVSPFLAARIIPVPSVAKMEKIVDQICSVERDQIIKDRTKQMVRDRFPHLSELRSLPSEEAARRFSAPEVQAEVAEYRRMEDSVMVEVNREQRAKVAPMQESAKNKEIQQEHLAVVLACLSPYANFVLAATDLTETGLLEGERWEKSAEDFSGNLSAFAAQRYEETRRTDPSLSSDMYLDLHGRPRFSYVPSSMAVRAEASVVRIGVLAVFAVLFLAGAYVKFARYDVR